MWGGPDQRKKCSIFWKNLEKVTGYSPIFNYFGFVDEITPDIKSGILVKWQFGDTWLLWGRFTLWEYFLIMKRDDL